MEGLGGYESLEDRKRLEQIKESTELTELMKVVSEGAFEKSVGEVSEETNEKARLAAENMVKMLASILPPELMLLAQMRARKNLEQIEAIAERDMLCAICGGAKPRTKLWGLMMSCQCR